MDNQESVLALLHSRKEIKEASSAIWKATSIPTRRRVKTATVSGDAKI